MNDFVMQNLALKSESSTFH